MIRIIAKENKDVHDYLQELDEKIKRAKEATASTPRIGVYWLHLKDGKVKIFHSEPITLDFGQQYGDFVIAPSAHINVWESLKQHGIVPKNSNYTDLPRGRVAFNKITKQFVVFHGKWINSTPTIKSVIKNEFKLPSSVKWVSDLHYHAIKRWGF